MQQKITASIRLEVGKVIYEQHRGNSRSQGRTLEADFAYEPHSKDIRCTSVTSQKSNRSKCKYLFGKNGDEVRQNMYQLQSGLALQSGVRCARIGNLALSAVFCRIKALIKMSQWVSILSFIQNAASLTTLRPAAIIATNCFRRWYLFY